MIKNILFDLDGTLINIDQEGFNKEYMDGAGNCFAKYGYDKNITIKLLWGAIVAIVHNDGVLTNEEIFCDYLEKNLNMIFRVEVLILYLQIQRFGKRL